MHEAVEAALAIFPRLDARRNQPASTLSGGERQMLALAKSIVRRPAGCSSSTSSRSASRRSWSAA